ncbi:MAG: GDP-mannose pyrophosphatase [Segetibacter sp.]|nr:GDP-mannose pyrophosphatase [Segetibacter sp.]
MAERITIKKERILSDEFFTLKNVEFEYIDSKGKLQHLKREVYMSGNGVAVLLYNRIKNTVVLIQQLRIPTFLNQNPTGMMIEVCAGLLEDEKPEEAIIREIKEETGYEVTNVEKVLEAYSTPGAIAEKLHYFIAEYTERDKKDEGGGLDEEQEDIEILEMSFDEAYGKIKTGEIQDAKTIMLLQHAKIHILDKEENVFEVL